MDVLLPPPGATKETNRRLAQVLEKLGSKIDRFNNNIENYNRNVIESSQPQPKKLYIPKYLLIFIILVGLYMFVNKRPNNSP
jgi:hypothetical protein